MAHSPRHLSIVGKLVAHTKEYKPSELFDRYFDTMMEALQLQATVKKNVNVLHHMAGYFKKQLSAEEKQEFLEIIARYHRGLVPLIVPVTMINHYAKKYDQPYLKSQYYLNPHPAELMLRNHV
jgi:uncharacterized protein YbgA (DUF1722 family)